jgi:hypothetical protein
MTDTSAPPGVRRSGFGARPFSLNPSASEAMKFAAYRADAIARDHEQRLAEGRERHPEFTKMRAEAMQHAYALVGAGLWADEDVAQLTARLEG